MWGFINGVLVKQLLLQGNNFPEYQPQYQNCITFDYLAAQMSCLLKSMSRFNSLNGLLTYGH